MPYIGGTIFHILRLIYDFKLDNIPSEIDWFIVTVGAYGGLGLLVFVNKVPFKGIWDKIGYGLLIFHLDGSIILHAYILIAGNHDILNIFPYWYSYIAVVYFFALGLYVLYLNKRLYSKSDKKIKSTNAQQKI
jgi:hypothetical protein